MQTTYKLNSLYFLHPARLITMFIDNIKAIYPETGQKWLMNLPALIMQLAEKWEFKLIRVMPELSYNYVAMVEFQHQSAIIKIAPIEHSLKREYLCLNGFQKSSPAVFHFDEKLNAILMEHVYPGEPLKYLVKTGFDDKATKIICEMIRELTLQTIPPQHPFKHLSELANNLTILTNHLDEKLLNKAIALFKEPTCDRSNDIMLHGDLHHDNILSSDSNWKIIDPHGYTGDPAAEVGAMIRNPYDCFPNDKPLEKTLLRRLSILRDELPYDFERIKAWCYCSSVLSAAWTCEDFKKVNASEIMLIKTLNHICKL